MRLGFISDGVYPYMKGGVEIQRYEEMIRLAKNNDVYSFSMRFDKMRSRFYRDRIHYIALGNTSQSKFYSGARRRIRTAIKFALALPLILFRYRFDVLHVNEFPYLHLPFVKLYCMVTRCKLVLSIYEVWDRDYWMTYLGRVPGRLAHMFVRMALSYGDAYVANSSRTADKLKALGIEGGKIRIFAPVIDSNEISRVRNSKARKSRSMIFAGRLIREKRIDKFIEVAGKVKDTCKGFNAVVVGDGPEKDRLKALVRELHLKDTVDIRPFYKDKLDLYKRIRESAVLLHMSEREGLSIITLESIALGTPVVLPNYSPIPKEVKSMCIVRKESEIPKTIVEIFRSKDKGRYIKNIGNLDMFNAGNTRTFYARLFKELCKEKRK